MRVTSCVMLVANSHITKPELPLLRKMVQSNELRDERGMGKQNGKEVTLVAWSISEFYSWFCSIFCLVRIFVTMILEISLLKVSVGRIRRTVCKQFQCVRGLSVVIPFEARMSFRLRRPVRHLIPVSALSNLPISDVM